MEQKIQIVPISENLIASYHQALDAVAREREYIMFLQAPPFGERITQI